VRDNYGSITSLASSTSLISPQVCVTLWLGRFRSCCWGPKRVKWTFVTKV
jgi:hypothetical protein